MKYYQLSNTHYRVSAIGMGCMRIANKSVEEVEELIDTALDCGINFFDHADIYGGGKSEEVFGEVLAKRPELRDKMIIQSKCGIVPGKRYDFSKDYIINAVNGTLDRLQTDHLDLLLLHRPDALCDYEEVADAFNTLLKQRRKGMPVWCFQSYCWPDQTSTNVCQPVHCCQSITILNCPFRNGG